MNNNILTKSSHTARKARICANQIKQINYIKSKKTKKCYRVLNFLLIYRYS